MSAWNHRVAFRPRAIRHTVPRVIDLSYGASGGANYQGKVPGVFAAARDNLAPKTA